MTPRTNACHCIQRLKGETYYCRNDLYTYTPCWGLSRHNLTPRLRRDLHANHRTLKSSRSSVTTSIPVSRDQLNSNRRRRHAIWARKSLSFPRGARSFLNTHTLKSNNIEDSGEKLQVGTGDEDVSIKDKTVSGNENVIDEFETSLSPATRNDIKTFRHLWNRKIIRISRDFKIFKDKGHSIFKVKLRIPNSANNDEEAKLRVRGEMETTSMVRTYCPHELCFSFI